MDTCRDPDQTTDILTKALPHQKHVKHVAEMGLTSAWGGVLGLPMSKPNATVPERNAGSAYALETPYHLDSI
jgi:hypothetical protein